MIVARVSVKYRLCITRPLRAYGQSSSKLNIKFELLPQLQATHMQSKHVDEVLVLEVRDIIECLVANSTRNLSVIHRHTTLVGKL
jgi:hypothetical protein